MEQGPIIIDNGSYKINAGYAGKEDPVYCINNIIGKPKENMKDILDKDFYIGNDALNKSGVLDLKNPIENGTIIDWDDMTKIWKHLFRELIPKKNIQETNVFLTEAPLTPKEKKEKMTEIMFEKFNVPAMYTAIQAVLSLYASGRTSGLVLDSGADMTCSVAVYEGYAVPSATFVVPKTENQSGISGNDMTNYLMRKLQDKKYGLTTVAERDIVREIKEKICYVRYDIHSEKEKQSVVSEKTYKLPDGETICIGEEIYNTPEIMFNPMVADLDIDGVQKYLLKSIKNTPYKEREVLCNNLIIAGGNTMFSGFTDRLMKELTPLVNPIVPNNVKIKMIAPQKRYMSSYVGGSILASLSSFKDLWITKSEYQEQGASIVHRKCF